MPVCALGEPFMDASSPLLDWGGKPVVDVRF